MGGGDEPSDKASEIEHEIRGWPSIKHVTLILFMFHHFSFLGVFLLSSGTRGWLEVMTFW
jgi:hypothetical protein